MNEELIACGMNPTDVFQQQEQEETEVRILALIAEWRKKGGLHAECAKELEEAISQTR